ncbi:MAG TPA: SNF2-related protein, partial [Acidobacteriota bacterium]|nr:SNF2-related protein [Acidobacteriota bacterium]
ELPFPKDPQELLLPVSPPDKQTVLSDLYRRGLLEPWHGLASVPHAKIYELSEAECQALGIPAPIPLSVELNTRGIPGRSSFRVVIAVRHPRLGLLGRFTPRLGPFYLPYNQPPILVRKPLYSLLQVLDSGAASSEIEDHFAHLARVQELGKACGATLKGLLGREEYEFPEAVEIELEEVSADRIELAPTLRGFYAEKGLREAIRQGRLPAVHFIPQGRSRRRFVFSAQLRKTLKNVVERRVISGIDVPRFLENPEAFLPEGIDLSEFSKRVKGLKTIVYNSRPYLHVVRQSGNWLDVSLHVRIEPSVDPSEDNADEGRLPENPIDIPVGRVRRQFEEAAKHNQEYVRFKDGWLRVPSRMQEVLEVLDKGHPTTDDCIRLPRKAALEIFENLELLEYEEEGALPTGWRLDDLPRFEMPYSFHGDLLPYQKLGLRWMTLLASRNTGGLLADEMGLGKTVQALAHIARLAERGQLQPSLIVCPKTLLSVWHSEMQRFLPSLGDILVLSRGPVNAEDLKHFSVVLCSYDTLRRNQVEMARVDWQLVVSDEAQYVKNPTAQRTSALKALKSRHRVALTGTPVENGLIEFWCIFDFIRPGLLGSWKDFRTRYERPLSGSSNPTIREEIAGKLLQNLGTHYLRRTKEEVAIDLPPKEAQHHEISMSAKQLDLYLRIAEEAVSAGRGALLAAIHRLFLVCGHPDALQSNLANFYYAPGISPKLDRTLALLGKIRESRQKVIIFTRWIALQRILQSAIQQVFGIPVLIINGQTQGDRMDLVNSFSSTPGFSALVLSHDVGGLGLTITEANHVVHFSRPWNPAKEMQATDRVHRIGQKRSVTIYYPIVVHPTFTTVEMRLADLLEQKTRLAKDVLRPTAELLVRPEDFMDTVTAAAEAGYESSSVAEGYPQSPEPCTVSPDETEDFAQIMQSLSPGSKPAHVRIRQGATGYSFDRIFKPFLPTASKVELRDPDILRSEALPILVSMVKLIENYCHEGTKLRIVGRPTLPDEKEIIDSYWATLRSDLAVRRMSLDVREDPDAVDTHVRTDTGWRIVLPGGLNIYNWDVSAFPISETEQLRTPCRETEVHIYREAGRDDL